MITAAGLRSPLESLCRCVATSADVKLADIRSDSWFQLVVAIERKERLDHRLLAAALRRGENVPAAAQEYLANVVEKAPSLSRGRPPKPIRTSKQAYDVRHNAILEDRDRLIAQFKEQ